jgi:hypothetical protein
MRTGHKLKLDKAEDFERNRLKVLYELGTAWGLDINKVVAAFIGKSDALK